MFKDYLLEAEIMQDNTIKATAKAKFFKWNK